MNNEGYKSDVVQTAGRIVDVVRQFGPVLEQAKALGLFMDDRELLECPGCGLVEDVGCDGRLMTYRDGEKPFDSGLRFKNVSDGCYRCPACGMDIEEALA